MDDDGLKKILGNIWTFVKKYVKYIFRYTQKIASEVVTRLNAGFGQYYLKCWFRPVLPKIPVSASTT